MGVTGLWTVVAPTARPTQLASLNRKRLAVDASIWIYQFLKAVRDKEGNALRNSHVVGFFRRICKLLYFGIKPVFVFDGGAPVLKRETIRKRVRRREGRREDAARTAGKLLAVQVARAAAEEDQRRKTTRERTPPENDQLPDDDAELVYVDEIGMTEQERKKGRGFKKKDQYHLPELDVSLENMGAPNDPRIMSQAELEEYARQFHSGEDINLYDFSKIDFESPFFLSLPAGDRYNILNAARLRSRLRMGYSKEQLDGMFPDRMAFSKFQIERVKERNELTQRLMHLNGMSEDLLGQGGRIAGEKGKEYVLVRNDGVEGGWALGVVSNKEGTKRENAIDLEKMDQSDVEIEERSDEDEDFEDIAIEGLNRLPKSWKRKRKEVDYDMSYEEAAEEIARKRKSIYEARKNAANEKVVERHYRAQTQQENPGDGLFVEQDEDAAEEDLFEDVDIEPPTVNEEDDDDLQKAIALSLQKDGSDSGVDDAKEQDAVGRLIDEDASSEDDFDFRTALAKSRKTNPQPKPEAQKKSESTAAQPPVPTTNFQGPLPFESLNLGQFLLGKKKSKKVEEDLSGGFDRKLGDDAFRKERPAQPLPSWFEAAPSTKDFRRQQEVIDSEPEADDDTLQIPEKPSSKRDTLQRHDTKEVIDVDADDVKASQPQQVIDIDDSDSDPEQLGDAEEQSSAKQPEEPDMMFENEPIPDEGEDVEKIREAQAREERYKLAREIAAENESDHEESPAKPEVKMDTVAEKTRAQPPKPTAQPNSIPSPAKPEEVEKIKDVLEDEAFSDVDWSESDHDEDVASQRSSSPSEQPFNTPPKLMQQKTQEDEFEDIEMEDTRTDRFNLFGTRKEDVPVAEQYLISDDEDEAELPVNGSPAAEIPANGAEEFVDDYMSDSDEELMRQLVIEAEEHARFASSLNNTKTPAEAARDYENELKQLRNQQKRDRRDADEVTHVMIQECQALLRLFGLPYITAPMEAEAQCAELVHLGLVDGIVTDDSDIFLFGGTRIYKNMFNAAKFVECYLSTDLEKEYALDRRKLIRFAHLLGSDYTEGVPGIGPVSALEIITEFSTLEEFREWCSKVQHGRPQDLESQLTTPFRRKFRNTVQKRLFLPPGFPDVRVDLAYLNPEVDGDPEEFQWGVPDLDKLRGFLMSTIGWSQERTDEILVPVIRDMNKRDLEGTQANLTRFFSGGVGVGAGGAVAPGATAGSSEVGAPRNRTGKESGRMAKAFSRLRGEAERQRRGDLTDVVQQDEKEGGDADPGSNVDGRETSAVGQIDSKTTRSQEPNKTKPKKSKSKSNGNARSHTTIRIRAHGNGGGTNGNDMPSGKKSTDKKTTLKKQRKKAKKPVFDDDSEEELDEYDDGLDEGYSD